MSQTSKEHDVIEHMFLMRKYNVYHAKNQRSFLDALSIVQFILQTQHGYSSSSFLIPYDKCLFVTLTHELDVYALVVFEGSTHSILMVDVSFPEANITLNMLNQCMRTFWSPVDLDSSLICGLLIEFMDGNLEASLSTKCARIRQKITITNNFVENALINVHRDDHISEGLGLLLSSFEKMMLKCEVEKVEKFGIANTLRVKIDGSFRLNGCTQIITMMKLLSQMASTSAL